MSRVPVEPLRSTGLPHELWTKSLQARSHHTARSSSSLPHLPGAWISGGASPFRHSLSTLGCVGRGDGYTSEPGQRGSSFHVDDRGWPRSTTDLLNFRDLSQTEVPTT